MKQKEEEKMGQSGCSLGGKIPSLAAANGRKDLGQGNRRALASEQRWAMWLKLHFI